MEKSSKLTDGRVTLRRYRVEDAAPIYEAVRESIREISQWMPWCHKGYSLEDSKIWSASRNDAWAEGKEYDFVIFRNENDLPFGVCGLNHIDKENFYANAGYWIRTSKTKLGVAPAALLLLAGFGFDELKLNRIEIVIATNNQPSQRVAEKVGATREGILRKRLIVRDRIYDAFMYSLIPGDLS